MKRLIAISLLFTTFWGCHLINPGTCPDAPSFFDIDGLMLNNRVEEANFYCCSDYLQENELVNFDQHRFYGDYSFTYHANIKSKGGFFSQAFALSCIEPGYEGSKETIADIIVTTNYDINENYLAGDTINNLMMYSNALDLLPLSEYLNGEYRSILVPYFWLYFTERPTATDTTSINLTIILDNGERYTETTESVIYL